METTISRNNNRYQILTPNGFADFSGVSRKIVSEYLILDPLENQEILKCTKNHKVKINGCFIQAEDIPVASRVITEPTFVYDPINVDLGHEYLIGSIVNHNCVEFQGSSGTLISGWKLKQLEYVKPLVEAEGLATYFHPEKSHQYACIVDVSRGKGLDYSAFHIIDITMMPYRQVCTYRSNSTTPLDYAEIVYRVCKSYNSAHCLVELNDIGGQVADAIFESFDYENILYTESAGRAGKRLTRELGKQVDRGVRTTKTLKSIGCSMLKLLVEQNQLEIIDKETISELKTFSKKNNSYEAEQGKHDDLVMGLVLFAWMSDQDMFKQMTDINTLQNLRDSDEEDIQNQLLPFGLWDGGAGNEVVIDSTEKREGWQLAELTDKEWNEIAYEDTSWTRGRF